MKFGIFLLGSDPTGMNERRFDEMLEQVEYAEELGFESVWLAEHHGSRYGTLPTPAVFAATIAARTSRIRIGMAVAILPFQHPVRTAEEWAMVDALSGGRLDFGIGRGYQPREFEMMGVDPAESREIFAESLEIILGLWENERFSFEGKHFRIEDVELVPKPVQQPIPRFIASMSSSTFAMAADRGFQIMTTPAFMPLVELKEQIVGAATSLIEHGLDPAAINFPMQMMTHVAPAKTDAIEASRPALDWIFERLNVYAPGGGGVRAADSFEEYEDAMKGARAGDVPTVEALIDSGQILVSDPEGACARLRELERDIGLRRYMCFMDLPGMSHEAVMGSMEVWAREVMPHFGEDAPVPEAFTRAGSAGVG